MEFSKEVKKHILFISSISGALTAVMIGIFALIGQFSLSVLWGALFGLFLVLLNFVLLAITLNKAADVQSRGKAIAGISYTSRMLFLLLGSIFAIVYLKVNPIALIIPYVFPRISIGILQALNIRDKSDKRGAPNGN
ncbi:MAG: ATP synthase subunit I [Eubacteriales bacterium]|nr:ATP synthase subunit I [Eubacteriales bacterium]